MVAKNVNNKYFNMYAAIKAGAQLMDECEWESEASPGCICLEYYLDDINASEITEDDYSDFSIQIILKDFRIRRIIRVGHHHMAGGEGCDDETIQFPKEAEVEADKFLKRFITTRDAALKAERQAKRKEFLEDQKRAERIKQEELRIQSLSDENLFKEHIINSRKNEAEELVNKLINKGHAKNTFYQEFILPAIDEMVKRFFDNQLYIPEIMTTKRLIDYLQTQFSWIKRPIMGSGVKLEWAFIGSVICALLELLGIELKEIVYPYENQTAEGLVESVLETDKPIIVELPYYENFRAAFPAEEFVKQLRLKGKDNYIFFISEKSVKKIDSKACYTDIFSIYDFFKNPTGVTLPLERHYRKRIAARRI